MGQKHGHEDGGQECPPAELPMPPIGTQWMMKVWSRVLCSRILLTGRIQNISISCISDIRPIRVRLTRSGGNFFRGWIMTLRAARGGMATRRARVPDPLMRSRAGVLDP